MDALMLTRDEGEQLTRWDGKRVVLLDNEHGNYREWYVHVAPTDYYIINEGDTWTLLSYVPDSNEWCDASDDVDAFLTTHKLILAA